ncbi:MAG: 3'(2'),5'-bisphosphate nucleotidase CysQ [Erysipelotrichaceae bacterium]|nr:3'(2'),5'-bisphosphate nucleotidase CysQ [Erysipelotrichaceae bacterium]
MYEKELEKMKEAASKAQTWILSVYHTDFQVEIKSDDSPVTSADKGADKIIRDTLGEAFPDFAFLTEESKDTKERLSKEYVFVVDPVDGTKEFVSRNGQFTTNIALVRNHEVVVGLINIPMLDTMFFAIKGQGAWKQKRGEEPVSIHVSDRIGKNLRALRSISFFNGKEKETYEKHPELYASITPLGAAQKFCAIAEGQAEVFYRFSAGTKEWDVAAGDLILSEAGGIMIVPPNQVKLKYNREDVYNRQGYVLLNRIENLAL